MRTGSLFSGYAGLDMAVEEIFGATPAWFSEFDDGPSKILAYHWPDVPNLGDITKIDWAMVPRVEILTGGFPCQDVSPAGLRAGLTPDSRSGLWHHFALAISKLRPRYVVIENVRGLLSARGAKPTEELMLAWAEIAKCDRVLSLLGRKHRRAVQQGKEIYVQRHATDRVRFMGRRKQAVAAARRADARIVRAIGTVLGDLADLGYDAQWCGLKAADVGAPHGRFREFIFATDAAGRGADAAQQRRFRQGIVPRGDSATDAGNDRRGWCTERDGGPGERIEASLGDDLDRCAVTATDPDQSGPQGPEPAARRVLSAWGAAADADDAGRQQHSRTVAVRPQLAAIEHGGDLAADTKRDGLQGAQPPSSAPRSGRRPADQSPSDWGQYAPAIHRWERVLGRVAPAPTELGAKGGQRLAPRFVEWMQGLPAGHVTDVPDLTRNEQLKALGNGVVPQQAAAALRHMANAVAMGGLVDRESA